MRKGIGRFSLILAIVLGLALLGGPGALTAPPDQGEGVIGPPWQWSGEPGKTPEYVPDEILVKFKPELDLEAIATTHDRLGAQVIGHIPQLDIQILRVPFGEVENKVKAYQDEPGVEFAEPNYIVHAFGSPNDPYLNQQWALTKIQAIQAWDLTTGSSSVVIAILDTGVDLNHEDLQGKLLQGYDFANRDNDPSDDHGHGTHVAGIAAAATNNGRGVAGVSYNCRIMPVKVLSNSGSGSHSWIAQGITYATDQGARVINMSLGGYISSYTLEAAVEYAWNHGVLLVAAAGNDSTAYPSYPAAYEQVMGVSATDRYDQRASFSNYGSYISVAAPGVSILSTVRGGSYQFWSGTSMASPHVAGLAGLVFAQDPSRTNATVQQIIEGTADDLGSSGWDHIYGYGRINAYRALSGAGPVPTPTLPPSTPGPTATPASDFEHQVVELINQERLGRGLTTLTIDERLMQAARRHSQDMATNNFFSHTGSDGSSPWDRIREAGYPMISGGETIAGGYINPSAVVDAWMRSLGHRAILLGSFRDIGVGYAYNSNSTYRHYWTADFGTSSDGGQPPTPTPLRPTDTPWPTNTPTNSPTRTPAPAPPTATSPPGSTTVTLTPTADSVGWV
ncbi:MAG: S8 family serine peptidase, partial [Anaerolineae bacterium]